MATMNATINLFGTNYNVTLVRNTYMKGQALAVSLNDASDGSPFTYISVNLPPDSAKLPPNTFYCKDWSENATIIPQLEAQGLIKPRPDIDPIPTGFVVARAYELTVKE